jgi:Protein of unknown function, DUF261
MIQGWLQTDKRLDPEVQKYGCALLSACYIAPQDFQPQDVNDLYKALVGVGFETEDCTILDWDKVLWSISARMRFKAKMLEGYICRVNEREILKWYLSNVEENHFTVGNGSSKTEWDSMNRPDIMKAYATFVEKVVITIS